MMWPLLPIRIVSSSSCRLLPDRSKVDTPRFLILHGQAGQVPTKLVRPWETGEANERHPDIDSCCRLTAVSSNIMLCDTSPQWVAGKRNAPLGRDPPGRRAYWPSICRQASLPEGLFLDAVQ